MRHAVVMLWIGALALMVLGVAMVPERSGYDGFSRGNSFGADFAPSRDNMSNLHPVSFSF